MFGPFQHLGYGGIKLKLYVVLAVSDNGTDIADLPGGALFTDKNEVIKVVKNTTNIPDDVKRLEVIELIPNTTVFIMDNK